MTDNEVARRDEVLAALTRILRREATESAIVTTRERVPTLCADGKVRYSERTDTRVVEIPPKISDVNRAADLLGRRCGLWNEEPEPSGETVRIVDDVGGADAGGAAASGEGRKKGPAGGVGAGAGGAAASVEGLRKGPAGGTALSGEGLRKGPAGGAWRAPGVRPAGPDRGGAR